MNNVHMNFRFNGWSTKGDLHAKVSEMEGYLNSHDLVTVEKLLKELFVLTHNEFVLGTEMQDGMFGPTMLYFPHVNGVKYPGFAVLMADSDADDHFYARAKVLHMVLNSFSDEVDA